MSRATLERDAYALDAHIIPDAGDWLLSRITLADLDGLVDEWCEKLKPNGEPYRAASVNTWIKVLKLLIAYAYRQEGLGRSPAEDLLNLPADTDDRGRALPLEEVRALLAVMRRDYPQHYALAVLGFATGQRFSELTALHWEDIDLEAGVIHFAHSQYCGTRKRGNKVGRKTTFPLLRELAELLDWHRRYLLESDHPGAGSPIVFPAAVPWRERDQAAYRGYLSRRALSNALESSARTARIERVTPHDMRRTVVTRLRAQGVATQIVQAIVGHSTDEQTAHYDHVEMSSKSEAVSPYVLELVKGAA